MITRLHHIDYVVRDLDKAVRAYEKIFQAQIKNRTRFDPRGVEVAWFKLEGVMIALVSPTQPDSPVQKFLDEHGEGFFHIAYEVDSLDTAIEHFHHTGIKMVSETKRAGIEGWDIIELDIQETFGAVTQLVETRKDAMKVLL